MKTLYLECGMGAAGDMLMAALMELTEEKDAFIKKMNGLGLPGVKVAAEKTEKCGVTGTHIRVTVDGEEEHSHDAHSHDASHDHPHGAAHRHHHHASIRDIAELIGKLDVSEQVKRDALGV